MRVHSVVYENNSTILVGQVMYHVGLIGPELPLLRSSTTWTESTDMKKNDPVFYSYVKKSLSAAKDRELALLVRDRLVEEQDPYNLGEDRWRREASDLTWGTPDIILTNECFDDRLEDIPADSYFCRMKKREGTLSEALHKLRLVSVKFLQPHEADRDDRATSFRIRRWWRGLRTEAVPEMQGLGATTHRSITKYTAVDGFCGIGGVSQGMNQAGVEVSAAFDKDENTIKIYKPNMPLTTTVYVAAVDKWLKKVVKQHDRPTFLHLSCPCQPYSRAHSTDGPNDVANRSCLLTIAPALEALRPRLLTLEQTGGMVEPKRKLWFTCLKSQLIEKGYSFRMKIVDMRDYSVAQKRSRLIIIASAPGEKLPRFPDPLTPEGRRKTIGDVLQPLYDAINSGKSVPNQRPQDRVLRDAKVISRKKRKTVAGAEVIEEKKGKGKEKEKKSTQDKVDKQIKVHKPVEKSGYINTVTTQWNSMPIHWETYDGKLRRFTIEELKLAQGFDLDFKLKATKLEITQKELCKQIGNAVPPPFAKALYQHLVEHLRKTDRQEVSDGPRASTGKAKGQSLNLDEQDQPEQLPEASHEESDDRRTEFQGFDDQPRKAEKPKGRTSQRPISRKRPPPLSTYREAQAVNSETDTQSLTGFSDADAENSSFEQDRPRKRFKGRKEFSKSKLNEVQDEVDAGSKKVEDSQVRKVTRRMSQMSSPSR